MFKKIIISTAFLIALVFLFNFKHAQAASLSLNPNSGKVNSQFNLTGSGLTSGFPAMVQWDDGSVLSQGTVDDSGNYSATATVPGSATVGAHTVSIAVAQPAMNPNPWWKFLIPRALAVTLPPSDYATATFTVTEDSSNPASSPTDSPSSSPTSSDSGTSDNQSSGSSQSTPTSTKSGSTNQPSQDPTTGQITNPSSSASPTITNASIKTKKSFWPVWWLIVLIILIAIAVPLFIFFYYKKKKKKAEEFSKKE